MVSSDYYTGTVLTLAICYTLTFGFCMYKTNKFGYFQTEWRHTKIFYLSVIIQTFIRMTTYSLLTFAINKEQRSNKLIIVMRSIPDTLFFINFVLLVYQTINIFYHSHMENRLHISLLIHFTRPMFRKARKLMGLLSLAWLGFMSLIYALLILGKLTDEQVTNEFIIVNMLSGTIVLVYLSYLYSKYLETPFKSLNDQKNFKTVSKVLVVWTMGRYIKGFTGLLTTERSLLIINDINPFKTDIGSTILNICSNLLTEIFCFVIVMDSRFINIFISQDEANLKKIDEEALIDSIVMNENPSKSTFFELKSLILGPIFKKRKKGFGELFQGKLLNKDILYRKISFIRISAFIVEDFKREIEELREKQMNGVLEFYGAVLNLPEIGLIYQAGVKSLFKLIHEEKVILSLRDKMNILREIGFVIKNLHKTDTFHGHLSSHNVILMDGNTPAIADLGLEKLKKYASLMIGYKNKGPWSSPEVWNTAGGTVVKPVASDDVYSFGVIIWEVITGEVPFEEVEEENLEQVIKEERRTPRVPEYFPKALGKILKMCWERSDKRSTIGSVYEKIMDFKVRLN